MFVVVKFASIRLLWSVTAARSTAPRSDGVPKGQANGTRRRTREEHSEETAEDYVELIAALITETGEARAIDMARRLGVTHVTVGRTVQRLQRDGFVTTQPYRSIFLTEAGRKLAEKARRRHQTVVDFLRSIGVPESVAQSDAEGIEHHVSAETLAAFRKLLARSARSKQSDDDGAS